MKVLIVNTVEFHINGMSTVIMNYYRYTKDSVRYDFVVNGRIDDCYREELNKNGEKIFILNKRQTNPLGYIMKLSKIIKEGNYDIVHIHGNSALMLIDLLACKLSGKNTVKVVHGHNTDCTHRNLHRLLYKSFIKSYDYGIACSRAAGKWLYGAHDHIVLNNGIQEERYRFDSAFRKSEREKNHITSETKVLLHIGLFNEQKNHTFLIDVFNEVLKAKPNTILRLVGAGKKMEDIKQKTIDLEIDDKVQFVGTTTHPETDYHIADVFVMPSLYESFGLVTVEAQCCGLPCVLSDSIPKEIKITNQVKFLSLEQSAAEWADYICLYLENTIERKSNEDCVVRKGYSIQHEAQKLVDFYHSVLK
ncbi:MAG: glycosyltransferase [Ruminococcus sp.]|nr:glycosyltransferase [Ruminococcus sp.]